MWGLNDIESKFLSFQLSGVRFRVSGFSAASSLKSGQFDQRKET
ncbi:hypothetical protein D1AOALGA4SA_5857 [Olavius algarvensis Delta 1 endosymbiont]|nr:hypothetical protein D1AOALGA4SA_5857 [Olavius algarvensis Delta 1 endosymbiont]